MWGAWQGTAGAALGRGEDSGSVRLVQQQPDLNRRESYWSCHGKSRAGLHPGVHTRPSELASFPPSFMLAPVLSATDRSLAT